MSGLVVANTVAALRAEVRGWRAAGLTVALVPTMGFLHRAHVALIEAARAQADKVVTSIFVNPSQFGVNEDFAAYPRDLDSDLATLAEAAVAVAFVPDEREMYPRGHATTVAVSGLTNGLCGARRPGHFEGVATVVAKLLLQCLPDHAYFGEKDYQQLLVIRRMARDLDIPVTVHGVATVREADGLAMSSRNAYLAHYPMQRQVDGGWLIAGCYLSPAPGESAAMPASSTATLSINRVPPRLAAARMRAGRLATVTGSRVSASHISM